MRGYEVLCWILLSSIAHCMDTTREQSVLEQPVQLASSKVLKEQLGKVFLFDTFFQREDFVAKLLSNPQTPPEIIALIDDTVASNIAAVQESLSEESFQSCASFWKEKGKSKIIKAVFHDNPDLLSALKKHNLYAPTTPQQTTRTPLPSNNSE